MFLRDNITTICVYKSEINTEVDGLVCPEQHRSYSIFRAYGKWNISKVTISRDTLQRYSTSLAFIHVYLVLL